MLSNHKISILNLENLGSSYVTDIISLLNKPDINYTNLDIIYFGYKELAQKQFIIFGKWLLNKFSEK